MNFVCNIVDVAGIEPTFKLVWLSPPISCLTISRPVEGPRVIYRCVPHIGCPSFTPPRLVHCSTCCLTDDLNSVTGLMCDNGYVAILFNV